MEYGWLYFIGKQTNKWTGKTTCPRARLTRTWAVFVLSKYNQYRELVALWRDRNHVKCRSQVNKIKTKCIWEFRNASGSDKTTCTRARHSYVVCIIKVQSVPRISGALTWPKSRQIENDDHNKSIKLKLNVCEDFETRPWLVRGDVFVLSK